MSKKIIKLRKIGIKDRLIWKNDREHLLELKKSVGRTIIIGETDRKTVKFEKISKKLLEL